MRRKKDEGAPRSHAPRGNARLTAPRREPSEAEDGTRSVRTCDPTRSVGTRSREDSAFSFPRSRVGTRNEEMWERGSAVVRARIDC